jgi:hypothetical protein
MKELKITKLLGIGVLAVLLVAPASSQADTATKRFAVLDGDHDGLRNPDRNASGHAALKIHRSHRTLCYRITFERMTAFHADIRRTRNDSVVTELYHEGPTDGPLEGCVSDVGRKTLKRMRINPDSFYVYLAEYHSLGQPPSEIAGTIGRRG